MSEHNIIVVGTSAGGVDALCELNKHVPNDLDASLFVVMHIGTETLLPFILSRCGNLPAVVASRSRGRTWSTLSARLHLLRARELSSVDQGSRHRPEAWSRENGHRPAVDVLFRSAARAHRSKVVGMILSGGRDDGSAGLYAIKARGGVAIVQDPSEALTDSMPRNALNMVDVDFCLPVRQIADVLVQLTNHKANNITESPNGGTSMENEATADRPAGEPIGDQIPVACPECHSPIYEVRNGELTLFQCFVGHRFAPESLSEQHTEALERALWTAIRTLKERFFRCSHRFFQALHSSSSVLLRFFISTSFLCRTTDLKLLREISERI